MIKNKNQTCYKSLYGNEMFKILSSEGFKWIDHENLDSNKNNSNSSKGCFLEVDLNCPKELCELHNRYSLAPDEIETKK